MYGPMLQRCPGSLRDDHHPHSSSHHDADDNNIKAKYNYAEALPNGLHAGKSGTSL